MTNPKGKFAARTEVPTEKSRLAIEKLLNRYGADRYRYTSMSDQAKIEFTVNERLVRITLPLPDRADFNMTSTGRRRNFDQATEACEQARRQRWRAMLLALQAKLESIECGIATFDAEFMPYTVDPQSGKTMAELVLPQIKQRYLGLDVPLLGLPDPGNMT